MIQKLKFKLEIILYHLKANGVYLIIGLVLGSLGFIFGKKIMAIFSLPQFHPQSIGIVGRYSRANLPEDIAKLISFGLTVNQDNDQPSLSPLVSSLDIQNNRQSYLFTLNPNLKWHSGKKLTAADINLDYRGLKLVAISTQQFKIDLDSPFTPILSVLSRPLIKLNFDGLGPYRVKKVSYKEGNIQKLFLSSFNSRLPGLIYRFYPSENSLIDAFQLGEVDQIKISFLPANFLPKSTIKISKDIETNKQYLAVFFNTNRLSNKQIRQSLAYATPKPADRSLRCLSSIAANSWAYNPSVKQYNFNPSRAKELFDSKLLNQIVLTVVDPELLATAENIKSLWQDILGIKVEVQVKKQLSDDYDAVLAYGAIPHDPDQYLFWHSTQIQNKTNITKLNNSRIDKLLEEGRQTADLLTRKQIYYDFQKYLLEESPVVFISYPTIYTIIRVK